MPSRSASVRPGKRRDPRAVWLVNFMSKVAPEPNGCWKWTGAYSAKRVGLRPVFCAYHYPGAPRGGVMMATRFILSFCDGVPLSERVGLEAAHRCDHDWCVNPACLFWATRSENEQDYFDKFGRKGETARRMKRATSGEGSSCEQPAPAPDDDPIPF